MEIKNSLYTLDSDFDILNMCNMFLSNQIAITENGCEASFVCPIQIKINGVNINVPKAFNVCYMLPTCSRKEIAYFQLAYSHETAKLIKGQFPEINKELEENVSIILKQGKLISVSNIKHSGDTGIGWHSIFMGTPDIKADITFDKIDFAEDKLPSIHTEATSRFQLLRNHILMTTISLSQLQPSK